MLEILIHTHRYDVYSRERNVHYVFITKDMEIRNKLQKTILTYSYLRKLSNDSAWWLLEQNKNERLYKGKKEEYIVLKPIK